MYSFFDVLVSSDSLIKDWLTYYNQPISEDLSENKFNLIQALDLNSMLNNQDVKTLEGLAKTGQLDRLKLTLKTKVVSVKVKQIRPKFKDLKEWMQDSNNVYIARKGIVFIDNERFPKVASIWANPFKEEGAIEKWTNYLREGLESGRFSLEELEKLRGKNLGCWCKEKPDIPCHGDIILQALCLTL